MGRYEDKSSERKWVYKYLRDIEDFVRESPGDYEESMTATIEDLRSLRYHVGEMCRIIHQLEAERDSLRAMWIELTYHDEEARKTAFKNWGLERLMKTSDR